MSKLDDPLNRLRAALAAKQDGFFAEAESCLADLSQLNDPAAIPELLQLLDASGPDELMFSILHAVEKWDDRIYGKALLDSVERLWEMTPSWAQILHIRVMNSPSTAAVYFDLVKSAPSATRGTVCSIYEAICGQRPRLTDKVSPILVELKNGLAQADEALRNRLPAP